MCGIIGEHNPSGDDKEFTKRRDSMSHRGPDATGFVKLSDGRVRLGHRRLAIIDLSNRADQPLIIDGYALVYNGEVYNFRQLAQEIGGQFTTTSDTEVILRGYIKYGPEIFAKLDGMFALAIYDPRRQILVLARDRFGIKPLYYYHAGQEFSFASEPQAVARPLTLSRPALRSYLTQNYIYGDEEIVGGLRSLLAGSYAVFDLNQATLSSVVYDKVKFSQKFSEPTQAADHLQAVLKQSVTDSLISDVPVGVFLSSGIDSSLIAALAQEITGQISSFTISFDFKSFDESRRSAEIANILGTDHHTVTLDKAVVLEAIPTILNQFHLPFGDSGALPFYFLCQYARQHVKVCLSGDGADELFGGYPIYYLPPLATLYQRLPWQRLIERVVAMPFASFAKMSFDYKLRRFVGAAKYNYPQAHFLYRAMHNEGVLKPAYQADQQYFDSIFAQVQGEDIRDQLMYVDQKTVLEYDYLVKADRMSMAHGLEVRVPFLNNQVVQFSRELDPNLKVRRLTTKYLLKRVLERYLPAKYIYRKKEGFAFPIASWLCLELRDFMLDTLSAKNIAQIEFLEYSKIRQMIDDHLAHRRDYNRELWGLISLVCFLRSNRF
ncbi:MAG: asparagine synthase (glutamine-hydrolyzing) [Candidatus Vogelbacteria bacterium RIFOXYD1_FULL_44_32]|uniref:asparagine synthase (glutamine-hydrolyzing) n=1 Tax=Candidatus Vogelbacteria bacterium RIFOXYD1_FULL_44_32 TaxID=1802438 RepID=A0A1G2QDB9_9BACT|nr:MAG: asparagine synthase (glutamine-hydrolyzing) [Candidatus Vogelbacteria bacterium RIFOXYD1_FULL_44_32]